MGSQKRQARTRRWKARRDKARDSAKRRRYEYERGFGGGVLAAKERFLVRDGLLSMTITRHWAAVKRAMYDKTGGTSGTPGAVHYEFLSDAALASPAFELWTSLARPGTTIKLVASAGKAKLAERAKEAAERVKVDTSGLSTYQKGDLVAELRVPEDGIAVRRTSSIDDDLSRHLQHDMPFAIPFVLVQWHSPGKADQSSERRVAYACSSFGVSIPGAVACKRARR